MQTSLCLCMSRGAAHSVRAAEQSVPEGGQAICQNATCARSVAPFMASTVTSPKCFLHRALRLRQL